jgi:hypothetical protein
MPLAIRRALPNVLLLTSACTSTSRGRDPSMQHSTADPDVSAGRHLEHAELADRAEAVLHRADDAMRVMPLTLEIQHRIDDVLERLGAGKTAILRHVADEKRGDVLPFR